MIVPALLGVFVIALMLTVFGLIGRDEPTTNMDPAVPSEIIPSGEISRNEAAPELSPEQQPDPIELSSMNGTLLYTVQDCTYRLILSFYRSNGEIPPVQHKLEQSIQSWDSTFTYSQLFVADDETGEPANEAFLEQISSFELDVIPLNGSAEMETEGPLINEEDPLALRSARIYYNSASGSNLIHWTITMKNGDVLALQHTLSISELRRSVYIEEERLISDDRLADLKWEDAYMLQKEISTVADAVAFLDQFNCTFYDALDSDFKMNIEDMLQRHRTEATGTDVYTAFTGWCLADDYPETKYLITTGSAHSFTWIYHGLLLPIEEGYRVVSPSAYSSRWNCVWGFDETTVPGLSGIETQLTLRHDGMSDDSGLPIYHLLAAEVGGTEMNFWMDGNYLITTSDAEELYCVEK